MKKIGILVLVFSLLGSGLGYAQQAWSLEQCIQHAISENIQIKQQELTTQLQKNTYTSSKLGVLPSLNGSAYQNFSFGRSVDPYTNEFAEDNTKSLNFSLASSMNLFRGLQQYHTIKKDELNFKASLKDLERAKNDISLSVASAYLNILFNMEMLDVSRDQVQTTEQQVQRTEKLVNAGSLAKGDLLEMQSQLANEQLQVVTAENNLEIAYLNLTQLLELDSVPGFKIQVPHLSVLEKDVLLPEVRQIFHEATQVLPQVDAAQLNLKAAGHELSVAKGARYPTLSVSASYGSGYSDAYQEMGEIGDFTMDTVPIGIATDGSTTLDVYTYNYDYSYNTRPFNDQIRDNASSSLQFGLTIPIFNGWQVNTAIDNARINMLNSKYNLDLTRKELYKDIQQAHADARAALKKYIATEKALEAMRESFRYTQKRFDVGMVNSVDYKTAKTQLNNTESELLQAKYEFIFKKEVLDFYRGNPISLKQ